MNRPNILLIITDQQHANMLSCAGNPWLKTPHLDALAARGTRYTRAYCGNPQCVPSRFSLFTGRMPSEIGQWSNGFRGEVPADIPAAGLGHLMQASGYATPYAGKQHFPRMTAEDLGFDVLSHDQREECAAICADYLANPQEKPFFLTCSLINPHDICYMAIRDFPRREMDHIILKKGETELRCLDEALEQPEGIDDETFWRDLCPPLPDNHAPQEDEPGNLATFLSRRDFQKLARAEWSEEDWRRHRWAYARLTERVDREIGTVLEGLTKGPNADNTLILFTSDHGDNDASHKLEHKTVFYEESANIPFIAAGPGVPTGKVDTTTLIQNGIDLAPTCLAVAQAATPGHLHGSNLLPTLTGQAPLARDSIYMQNELGQCVVFGGHKYARHHGGTSAEQLYDLSTDPGETRNHANDPAQAQALETGRQLLKQWEEVYGVTPESVPAEP